MCVGMIRQSQCLTTSDKEVMTTATLPEGSLAVLDTQSNNLVYVHVCNIHQAGSV